MTRRLLMAVMMATLLMAASTRAGDRSPRVFRDCPNCPEMVSISPERFVMGVPDGEEANEGVPQARWGRSAPQHPVSIRRPFAIGKFAVTRGQFAAFVSATGYQAEEGQCAVPHQADGRWRSDEQPGYSWRNPGFPQTDRHPVVCVSWDDAKAYGTWLSRKTRHSYRLPTEAEWEYAARAGSPAPRPWGNDRERICDFANVADATHAGVLGVEIGAKAQCTDGYTYTAPVGTFQSNRFGLYDMLGNVWQWQEDCWNENYEGAPSDGTAWLAGDCGKRAARGGAWDVNPRYVRSGGRIRNDSNKRNATIGFRVVRTE